MRAIDTNVLVRFILLDGSAQSLLAEATVRRGVFLPITVLLETAWVLSSTYAIGRARLSTSLAVVLDSPTVHVADESGIRWAIDRYAAGADLADMLHIVAAGDSTYFTTFDRKIAIAAGPDSPITVETLRAS